MYLQTMYMHIPMARDPQSPKTPRAPKTLGTDARAIIAVCPRWHSRLAARRIADFLERRMAGCGLSVAQFGLMTQVAAAADDTLGALAERMELDQSTLSRNLRALERDGLVEIANVERDQRRRMVWLTETGALRLEAAIPLWRNALADLERTPVANLARQLAASAEALARE